MKRLLLTFALVLIALPSIFALNLVKTIPSEGQSNYPISSKIVLQFSETMAAGTGSCTLNGVAVTPSFTGQYVIITPTFNYLTDYTLVVPDGALKGSSGATYGGLTLHFRTVAEPLPYGVNVGVSKDGAYQFTSLQAAIDAAPANAAGRHVIYVCDGTYEEKITIPASKRNLTIWGHDQSKVVVTQICPAEPVVDVQSDGCYLFNLSIRNSSTVDSSAALRLSGDKSMARYVVLSGTHRVLQTAQTRSYLYECTLLGSSDLVGAEGISLIDHCHLKQAQAGAFVLASTPSGLPVGTVLSHSRLLSSVSGSTIAKALNDGAAVYAEECELPSALSSLGWNKGVFASTRFGEYMNYGPGARRYEVAYLSSALSENYSMLSIFKNTAGIPSLTDPWNPFDVLGSTGKNAATWLEGNGYGVNRGGNGGPIYTVTDEENLIKYLSTDERCTVRVKGSITLSAGVGIGSNKTLTGVDEASTIIGNLVINSDKRDVIIQNINVSHPGTLKANDGISMEGPHRVLVKHVSFYDCSDGECDMRNGADSVTHIFNKMYYVNQLDGHRFTMICDGVMFRDADGVVVDYGNPLHITMHNNFWSTLCDQRMPSSTNAHAHLYNCYWNAPNNFYCSLARTNTEFYSENNYYKSVRDPLGKGSFVSKIYSSGNTFYLCSGEQWSGKDEMDAPGYVYTLSATSDVPAINAARAGNYWYDAAYVPNTLSRTSMNDYQPQIIQSDFGFQVRLAETATFTVGVYDLNGKLLLSRRCVDERSFSVENVFPKGVYVVKVESGTRNFTKTLTLN